MAERQEKVTVSFRLDLSLSVIFLSKIFSQKFGLKIPHFEKSKRKINILNF